MIINFVYIISILYFEAVVFLVFKTLTNKWYFIVSTTINQCLHTCSWKNFTM